MRLTPEMYPSHEELQYSLRCLLALYFLLWTFYAFVLRRVVKEAQRRSNDGTDWGNLCASVIFPRVFIPSTFLVAMIAFALYPFTNYPLVWLACGSIWETWDWISITVVSSVVAGFAAFISAFLAFCLAGSTPQKVLPRIYAVLLLPFTWITNGLLECL